MTYLSEEEIRMAVANYCGVPVDKVHLFYTYDVDETCFVEAEVDNRNE